MHLEMSQGLARWPSHEAVQNVKTSALSAFFSSVGWRDREERGNRARHKERRQERSEERRQESKGNKEITKQRRREGKKETSKQNQERNAYKKTERGREKWSLLLLQVQVL